MIEIESSVADPEIPKIRNFFVTAAGGLEDAALGEVRDVLKGLTSVRVEKRHRQGRIHFRYTRSPKRLLDLTSVEGVFADLGVVGGVTAGRPGLLRVAEAVSKVDIGPGIALYNILNGQPQTRGVAGNCSVGRGHRFSSSELHRVLRLVLAESYDLDESEQQGPYYLQVRIEGKRALIGFRLSERSLPKRLSSDLPITTICALGLLIRPESGEVWLDLATRSGSVIACFEAFHDIVPLGLETHPDFAGVSVDTLGGRNRVGLWEGHNLPVREAVVDGLFACVNRRSEIAIDEVSLSEYSRVLRPHGRVVLVTERDRDLERFLERTTSDFSCSERRNIQVGGEALALYHLQKTNSSR